MLHTGYVCAILPYEDGTGQRKVVMQRRTLRQPSAEPNKPFISSWSASLVRRCCFRKPRSSPSGNTLWWVPSGHPHFLPVQLHFSGLCRGLQRPLLENRHLLWLPLTRAVQILPAPPSRVSFPSSWGLQGEIVLVLQELPGGSNSPGCLGAFTASRINCAVVLQE